MRPLDSSRRNRGHAPFGILTIALCAATLAGCAGGDFGRTRASARFDDMHSWIGREATASIGQPASSFNLTDSERQLRDLAYPLIEPPRSRPEWAGVFGDYKTYPAPWRQRPPFDRTAYGRKLLSEAHRSPASRYGRLIEDIRDDITRIEPLFATALRVIDLDHKRNASLGHVSALTELERENARARIQENVLVVQWVQYCVEERISSYRWALERLVISAPDQAAVEAEQVLMQLIERAGDPRLRNLPAPGRALTARG